MRTRVFWALAWAVFFSGFLSSAAAAPATIELAESIPIETSLLHTMRDAQAVWLELIANAKTSIDIAQFYISNEKNSSLEPVLAALIAARQRNVAVRLLVDESMFRTYPEDVLRLAAAGVIVRRIDFSTLAGGVLHAKYFIVDGTQVYLGSQNFDYRSLSHIHELGVHINSPVLAQALESIFSADFALAGSDVTSFRRQALAAPSSATAQLVDKSGNAVRVELLQSPSGWLVGGAAPEEKGPWEFPRLLAMIDSAQRSIEIELFIYRGPEPGEKNTPMAQLESALRRAASRGVTIDLMLSASTLKGRGLKALCGLLGVKNITVKSATIPQASTGPIPFARLIHAKYMVVDGSESWLGSSNWEDRYFVRSRNVSILINSQFLSEKIASFFFDLWKSSYVSVVSRSDAQCAL